MHFISLLAATDKLKRDHLINNETSTKCAGVQKCLKIENNIDKNKTGVGVKETRQEDELRISGFDCSRFFCFFF